MRGDGFRQVGEMGRCQKCWALELIRVEFGQQSDRIMFIFLKFPINFCKEKNWEHKSGGGE